MKEDKVAICRLCLSLLEPGSFEIVDEVKQGMLSIILPEVKISATVNPVICKSCTENLQRAYDFKTEYLNYYHNVKMEIDEDHYIKCMFCGSFNSKLTTVEENILLRRILDICLGKGVDITDKTAVCETCMEPLQNQNNFMTKCQEVEEKLETYSTKNNNIEEINLFCVLQNEAISGNESIYTTELLPIKIENSEYDISDSLNHEIVNIKTDDEHAEYDMQDEMDDFLHTDDDDTSRNDRIKEDSHGCHGNLSGNDTMEVENIEMEKDVEEDAQIESYTVEKVRIAARSSKKVFKCKLCNYQTFRKTDLTLRHILIHKNPGEVTMYQCTECPYQSKRKGDLNSHMAKHADSVAVYRCKNCRYKTIHKDRLEEHVLKHSLPPKYQCEFCSYSSPYKKTYTQHLRSHKRRTKELYRCELCPYETKRRTDLTDKHMLVHKRPEELIMHKCRHCDFQMLKVGDKFESYEMFNKRLQEYKNRVFSDYWIRDCRTIELQIKRYPKSVAAKANKELIYYYLRIACIKGGRNYTPRTKKDSLTFRQKCPATMFLKLTSCGQFLEIKELNENHTHPVTKSLFKTLPQQLTNKKITQNNAESQCLVTLKDLTNLSEKPHKKEKFEQCISVLRNTYKCEVEICLDQEENLKCILFQDCEMKHIFESYPEILFIDRTYCSDNTGASTYLMMVEDAEGGTEIVACGILLNETEDTMFWFIETFKRLNPRSSDTTVIMSDKDDIERKVLKRSFPDASLQICLFHTLQIFNREISVRKMDLSAKECEDARNYLQQLAYASSEESYKQVYLDMQNNIPQIVMDYYKENWEPIKDQWVLYLSVGNTPSFNKTNKIENINAKLKSVISKFSDLEEFIKHFFVVLNSLRGERNIKNSKQYHKIATTSWKPNSIEDLYSKLLTNFAFKKVQQQIEGIHLCKDLKLIGKEKYVVPTNEGHLKITPYNCQCMFWKSMKLPCCHILKLRSMCNKSLYDERLVLERWKRTYFESRQPYFSRPTSTQVDENEASIASESEVDTDVTNKNSKKRRALTSHQKFKLMNDECLKLSQICSTASSKIFYKRLEMIKSLATKWGDNSNETFGSSEEETCANNFTTFTSEENNSNF